METRLTRLEASRHPRVERLVMVPLADWPAEGDEAAWDRLKARHPGAWLFLPDRAPSVEAWEGRP
jgi:hypothetical protein